MRLFFFILFIVTPLSSHAADVVDSGQQLFEEPIIATVQSVDLGQDARRGVVAIALLEPQRTEDKDTGQAEDLQTFRLSVSFVESETGKLFLEGQVAARLFSAGKRIADSVRLEPQESNWSGLLPLAAEGETLIKIGSKLNDGKKRIYRFFYKPLPAPQTLEGGELKMNHIAEGRYLFSSGQLGRFGRRSATCSIISRGDPATSGMTARSSSIVRDARSCGAAFSAALGSIGMQFKI